MSDMPMRPPPTPKSSNGSPMTTAELFALRERNQYMNTLKIGTVVWYRPSFKDPKFHDKGGRDILPAIVVKVWDAVVDVQVVTHPDARLDLHVLQDATCPLAFVPFVRKGEGIGEWSWPE